VPASLQRFQIHQCQPFATLRSLTLEREFFDLGDFQTRIPLHDVQRQRILNLLTSKTP
jgi:hypothetical protein